jgi:hypothetical protein
MYIMLTKECPEHEDTECAHVVTPAIHFNEPRPLAVPSFANGAPLPPVADKVTEEEQRPAHQVWFHQQTWGASR